MKIDGNTKSYGLIGNPVEHSISPSIHNYLAAELKQNIVYQLFQVESEELQDVIIGAHGLRLAGLNVTVPHKTDIIPHLASVEEDAKIIGAVNTLVYKEDGYHGMNTDYEGLHMAMLSDGITLEKEEVIILGAGGAARATLFMCMKYSRMPIYILNRTLDKAETLADEMNQYFRRSQVTAMKIEDFKKIPRNKKGYLAIQTTSVGLYPNIDQVIIEEEDFYEYVHIGYDIVYTPSKTAFMSRVTKAGGKSYNGLKMLLYQAVLAFEQWRKVKVPEELCQRTLDKMKEEMHER